MALPAKDRIRAKIKQGNTQVRILLAHPMHTGRAKDQNEQLIPAEFIQDIHCWHNGEAVLTIKCGTATARNPYFSFQLQGGQAGDEIALRWVDNLGKKGKVTTQVR